MAGLERALPAAWYLSDETFERERERLLYREWVCAGRADQLRRPGSLQVVEVAGESVLLVRTRAGELRAHYNVCRHRGSQVVPCPPAPPGQPQATPARKAGSLRCPYHSWTYRLEGDLLRAPWSEEIDGFDQAAFGLHPVGVATWGGFMFLHLTPEEAAPLADQLGPVPERLRRYPLEALAVGRRLAYRVGANWKLVAENYNECYHCAGVHPELCRVVPAFKRGRAGLDWDRGIPHREGAWTFTATGRSDRAPFPGLDEDERTRHKGELVYRSWTLRGTEFRWWAAPNGLGSPGRLGVIGRPVGCWAAGAAALGPCGSRVPCCGARIGRLVPAWPARRSW
jgi:glycine betaine catabolism A